MTHTTQNEENTLSFKNVKTLIESEPTPENSSHKIIVLPTVFKKYPNQVEQFINSYKKIGITLEVVWSK